MPKLLTDIAEVRAYFLNVFLPVRGELALRLFRELPSLAGRQYGEKT